MYSVQLACALQKWRHMYGNHVQIWLETFGEIVFIVMNILTTRFRNSCRLRREFAICGYSMGHPLLPASSFVRNDIRLDQQCRVLLVSGSNMSGKSTFLRVVGINSVLAMMAAPVRARELRLSPISIGSSIHASDSPQQGVSRFYAEIKRIRDVVALSSLTPTLFLFDEVLQGTNSQDGRVGAEGILRTLLQHSGVGLITTHDLALTQLAELSAQVRNVHFQERLEAGKLSFDYRIRDGVVTTSNGVELMRSVGLEV